MVFAIHWQEPFKLFKLGASAVQSESWRPRPGLPVQKTQIKCLARNLPGVTQSGSQPPGGPWRSLIILKAKTSIPLMMCYVCYAKSLQSYLTLCDPLFTLWTWGSSVHQIFQSRILEWAAISSSRGSSCPRDWTPISFVSCTGRQVFYH